MTVNIKPSLAAAARETKERPLPGHGPKVKMANDHDPCFIKSALTNAFCLPHMASSALRPLAAFPVSVLVWL
jgi:hypothetical protein